MNFTKDISVIVPVFNAEKSLVELISRLIDSLKKLDLSFELIFVDDFSLDNSWTVLKTIQKENPDITIVRLSKNYGQHNATVCGFQQANGNTIITLDDDLEHIPETIIELYNCFLADGFDLLYASSKKRKKSVVRNLISSAWSSIAKASKKGVGNASSYRIMKKELADCIINHKEPFIYIESIVLWYTQNIGIKTVEFGKRKHGKSNYSMLKLFSLNHDIGMHYDTHILKFMKNFGVTVFFGAMILIAYYFLKKIFGSPVPGYTSLIIVSLFSSGSILWGMGYLGIYIGKMFRILNKEPQYQVAEKINS